MTDNAPERIWAKPEHPDENGYGGFWIKAKVAPAVEYIRADLYTSAIIAALERLDASLFTNAEHQQAKDILRGALKSRQE